MTIQLENVPSHSAYTTATATSVQNTAEPSGRPSRVTAVAEADAAAGDGIGAAASVAARPARASGKASQRPRAASAPPRSGPTAKPAPTMVWTTTSADSRRAGKRMPGYALSGAAARPKPSPAKPIAASTAP